MKNTKVNNFFNAIFFRGNYGYLPTVIMFWLAIISIYLQIIYYYTDIYFKGLDILIFLTSLVFSIFFLILLFIPGIFSIYNFLNFIDKAPSGCTGYICFDIPSPTVIGYIFTVAVSLLIILLINNIIVKLVTKKRPTK